VPKPSKKKPASLAQAPLPGIYGALTRLKAMHDSGPVGGSTATASAPRHVIAENMQEYIIKGPSITPGHPFVAANELISVRLAGVLGLPVLDHAIIELAGDIYFGSAWMPRTSYYEGFTEVVLSRSVNRDRIYDIVVFDVWLCNKDRHPNNLVARRQGNAVGPGYSPSCFIILNDHSHCPVFPGDPDTGHPSRLPAAVTLPIEPRNLKIPCLADAVTDRSRLSQAIDAAQSISNETLLSIVSSVPDPFLPANQRGNIVRFLTGRRDHLRVLFEDGRGAFRNLGGGAL
jgi:hypothetical protein